MLISQADRHIKSIVRNLTKYICNNIFVILKIYNMGRFIYQNNNKQVLRATLTVSFILNRINYFGVTHLINWIIDLFNHDRFE